MKQARLRQSIRKKICRKKMYVCWSRLRLWFKYFLENPVMDVETFVTAKEVFLRKLSLNLDQIEIDTRQQAHLGKRKRN